MSCQYIPSNLLRLNDRDVLVSVFNLLLEQYSINCCDCRLWQWHTRDCCVPNFRQWYSGQFSIPCIFMWHSCVSRRPRISLCVGAPSETCTNSQTCRKVRWKCSFLLWLVEYCYNANVNITMCWIRSCYKQIWVHTCLHALHAYTHMNARAHARTERIVISYAYFILNLLHASGWSSQLTIQLENYKSQRDWLVLIMW